MKNELWLPVVGYEGRYEVSDRGRVRSLARFVRHCRGGKKIVRERLLRPGKRGQLGHLSVNLCNGTPKPHWIHRLVLTAFVGPCPEGFEGCHNDGDPSNNRLENLRWDTHRANCADQVQHGTSNRGERQGLAKLTTPKVIQIKILLRFSDLTHAEIGEMYGVSRVTITNINIGETWGWLEAPSEKEFTNVCI